MKIVATYEVLIARKMAPVMFVIGLYVVIKVVIIDMKMILVYSDIKINANTLLAYSVLNPDTNSLSPSARSNGVRFVSARSVVNQINRSGGHMMAELNGEDLRKYWRFSDIMNINREIKIRAILTS